MTAPLSSAAAPSTATVSGMATVYPGLQAMLSSVCSVKGFREGTAALSLALESNCKVSSVLVSDRLLLDTAGGGQGQQDDCSGLEGCCGEGACACHAVGAAR